MTDLIYVLPSYLRAKGAQKYPGMQKYLQAAHVYGGWVMPLDRTGVITIPLRTVSLFPMPAYRAFSKTYEEICNERAADLLSKAEKMNATIYVLYSGGIDSTCLLVSLLKNATAPQKKKIVVLLSHESIAENPRFFEEHIRGNLRMGSSLSYPQHIGSTDMILSAEHNDLVMGNASMGTMITRYGQSIIHAPYERERILEFFTQTTRCDMESAADFYEILERLNATAPVEIRSYQDFFWWYNFTTKWQACYSYMLFFTPPNRAHKVTREYLETRFISFYNTDDFQLWSMNNLDKRIKDSWKSYKWVIKDIIYDFNKDAEYREHKTKVASLPSVVKRLNLPFAYLDAEARFRNDIAFEDVVVEKNDFV